MNRRQLTQLGVPEYALNEAVKAVSSSATTHKLRGADLKRQVKEVLAAPEQFINDPCYGPFATVLVEDPTVEPLHEKIEYRTWGEDIDEMAHAQMREACKLPHASGAALMPDAHLGYGLPIGGVLALEGAVVPYAVGVDIACRMKLSVFDLELNDLDSRFDACCRALEKGTRFGVGSVHQQPQSHDVMDENWNITKVTRQSKDKAWHQLGTSGSGNHFVEFGVLTVSEQQAASEGFDLAPGKYVALLSHSGSRGPGAAVCSTYSNIARTKLPKKYEKLKNLAWLTLESEEGQEYWEAMNLMGRYAAANHEVIHRLLSELVGAEIVAGVENHHNFAWKETHHGREMIVHRKGATPAGKGVLGVIPGSMGTPGFVVRGKGEATSFDSASHGAGRCMSRKKANNTFRIQNTRQELKEKGVHILSAGSDEVPGVYKDIHQVMDSQKDLVDIVGRFDPKIVKMCGDGSRAED
ncbi:RtcB family protein [Blastopirellula marina]|uniref:3'-phosphate/5'-hydroxy nucleic acid ligase n=1 Tax=Blastopirellula marina TaxID=124 RepID=A0A2S8GD09_9BACT|nr:RtcB family protein [Blastopirellula marina]PQO42141.1 RNA-splicing ligase RtcB [Blastopirellula marina]